MLESKARRWEPLWRSEHTLRQQSQEAIGDVRLHLVSDQQEDCVHGPDEPGVVRGICTFVYRKINTFRNVTLFLKYNISSVSAPYCCRAQLLVCLGKYAESKDCLSLTVSTSSLIYQIMIIYARHPE